MICNSKKINLLLITNQMKQQVMQVLLFHKLLQSMQNKSICSGMYNEGGRNTMS